MELSIMTVTLSMKVTKNIQISQLKEVEGYIEKLNKGKMTLDEILKIEKTYGVHSGFGYVESLVKDTQQHQVVQRNKAGIFKAKWANVEKKRFFRRMKPRKPPPICNYFNISGHVWRRCFKSIRDFQQGLYAKTLKGDPHYGIFEKLITSEYV
ncbi:hypothetical protein M9H77_12162 [Catharanthus roseus]|uniref:Uncharacterized protein n=1 Tax=Catharanthus roseus TaxID=4058 RepID=A0ACC0BGT6_CATRO|nr:hypothetical protein M9H77_12162 [Catharanthus roseus]